MFLFCEKLGRIYIYMDIFCILYFVDKLYKVVICICRARLLFSWMRVGRFGLEGRNFNPKLPLKGSNLHPSAD